MSGPMDGVKVVEMGVWVAGPAAGGILADWGADVIKIEPPGLGDPARSFGQMLGGDLDINPVFEMDNRSKRSVVLDLTKPEAMEIALELIDEADVFVDSADGVHDGARPFDVLGGRPLVNGAIQLVAELQVRQRCLRMAFLQMANQRAVRVCDLIDRQLERAAGPPASFNP